MIFDTVKNIIVENLGCEADAVVMDASLIDDLGADSLSTYFKLGTFSQLIGRNMFSRIIFSII